MTEIDLPFRPANILLPRDCDMTLWSVVACDQYTSQPVSYTHLTLPTIA